MKQLIGDDALSVLVMLGEIAIAQPTHPRSYDAEQLLKRLGLDNFLRRCALCGKLPAAAVDPQSPADEPRYWCESCAEGLDPTGRATVKDTPDVAIEHLYLTLLDIYAMSLDKILARDMGEFIPQQMALSFIVATAYAALLEMVEANAPQLLRPGEWDHLREFMKMPPFHPKS